ncbi:MAG: phosphoglycerate kinase [bacterium]|nr:phosphoglycerate kinase [bacterium]
MKSITEAGDLKGKRVLVRVDWSVPMAHGEIINNYQITATLPTLKYLKDAGATVIVATHLESKDDSPEALKPYLPEGMELLSNLRDNPGEKANSEECARELASRADIYVNEAFPESHRSYASIVGVPKFLPSFAGLRLSEEVKELSKVFYPKKPFLFILGGAKFDTKLPLLKKFINIADDIFVGGALAHNFFRELGRDIGSSLVSDGDFGVKELFETGKIILPEETVTKEDKIVDASPIVIEKLKDKVMAANLILWNGPLGNYEQGYKVATLQLAQLIAESGNESIVGGGDTLAAIAELNLLDKFSFVSTGGGAMLDFLAKGTLPGIEALK